MGQIKLLQKNASINLKRNIRNQNLSIDDIKHNLPKFAKWLQEYKDIINNTEPFEWGLRFLLKQENFEKININTMKPLFVDAFPTSVRRAKIYEDYLQYINELKAIIGKDTKFTQLTFGSFVRDKIDAGDMDFVIFIPESIYYRNKDKIENLNKIYKSKFFNNEKMLDVTAAAIFPKNHEKYESKFGEELYYMLKKYATSDKQNIPQKTFILEF